MFKWLKRMFTVKPAVNEYNGRDGNGYQPKGCSPLPEVSTGTPMPPVKPPKSPSNIFNPNLVKGSGNGSVDPELIKANKEAKGRSDERFRGVSKERSDYIGKVTREAMEEYLEGVEYEDVVRYKDTISRLEEELNKYKQAPEPETRAEYMERIVKEHEEKNNSVFSTIAQPTKDYIKFINGEDSNLKPFIRAYINWGIERFNMDMPEDMKIPLIPTGRMDFTPTTLNSISFSHGEILDAYDNKELSWQKESD